MTQQEAIASFLLRWQTVILYELRTPTGALLRRCAGSVNGQDVPRVIFQVLDQLVENEWLVFVEEGEVSRPAWARRPSPARLVGRRYDLTPAGVRAMCAWQEAAILDLIASGTHRLDEGTLAAHNATADATADAVAWALYAELLAG